MIFVSLAEDKDKFIRLYVDIDGKEYCTDALKVHQVASYAETIMQAIMSFTSPLSVTTWFDIDVNNTPGTKRSLVGANDTMSEIYTRKCNSANVMTNPVLVESGMRGQISSTFVTLFYRLFISDPAATLAIQRGLRK